MTQIGINMDTLTNLKTFMAVTKHGGFSDAAKQLDVVPSVVAKRISQLETEIGTRLFQRSTRKVTITEAGSQLRNRASGLLAEFDDVVKSIQRDDRKLEGHIRLMAPTTLTLMRLGRTLSNFLAQHDRITMEISLVDLSTNPEEQSFDLAISGRTASYEGVIDVPLCSTHPVLVASPSFIQQNNIVLTHPRDLIEQPCLVFSPTGSRWNFQSSRGMISVEVNPHLMADDNQTLLQAAILGAGVAVVPSYVASDALKKREVIRLLPNFPLQDTWFRAYVPKRRMRIARIQALVDWITKDLHEFESMRTQ